METKVRVKMKRSVRVRLEKEAKKALPVTEATAYLKHVRIPSRKMTPVLDLIRGQHVDKAAAILRNVPRAASEPIAKLLHSATANAENNFGMDPTQLYIASCFATEGPTLKRMRPVSKGRGHRILKRTSHVTMILKEQVED